MYKHQTCTAYLLYTWIFLCGSQLGPLLLIAPFSFSFTLFICMFYFLNRHLISERKKFRNAKELCYWQMKEMKVQTKCLLFFFWKKALQHCVVWSEHSYLPVPVQITAYQTDSDNYWNLLTFPICFLCLFVGLFQSFLANFCPYLLWDLFHSFFLCKFHFQLTHFVVAPKSIQNYFVVLEWLHVYNTCPIALYDMKKLQKWRFKCIHYNLSNAKCRTNNCVAFVRLAVLELDSSSIFHITQQPINHKLYSPFETIYLPMLNSEVGVKSCANRKIDRI